MNWKELIGWVGLLIINFADFNTSLLNLRLFKIIALVFLCVQAYLLRSNSLLINNFIGVLINGYMLINII